MKSFLALTAMTLFASSALAFTNWGQVDSRTEIATTKKQFVALQNKYPEYFSSYDPVTVATASITHDDYRWQGPTMCPADDPRLSLEIVSGSIKFIDGSGTGWSDSMPLEADPCATR